MNDGEMKARIGTRKKILIKKIPLPVQPMSSPPPTQTSTPIQTTLALDTVANSRKIISIKKKISRTEQHRILNSYIILNELQSQPRLMVKMDEVLMQLFDTTDSLVSLYDLHERLTSDIVTKLQEIP
jgi:two-component sensor histidine kinase